MTMCTDSIQSKIVHAVDLRSLHSYSLIVYFLSFIISFFIIIIIYILFYVY